MSFGMGLGKEAVRYFPLRFRDELRVDIKGG